MMLKNKFLSILIAAVLCIPMWNVYSFAEDQPETQLLYRFKTLYEPTWDDEIIQRFGFLIVRKDGKVGLMDRNWKKVFDTKFKNFVFDNKGGAWGERYLNNGKKEIVGMDGKVAFTLPDKYKVNHFYNGQAVITLPGGLGPTEVIPNKAGVINTKGKWVIPFAPGYLTLVINEKKEAQYVYGKYTSNKYRDRKIGLLDSQGKTIIEPKFSDFIYHAVNDLVKDDGWEDLMSSVITDGIIVVANNNWKYGAIDLKGKLVIPYAYDEIHEFFDGTAIAIKGGKTGVISSTGKTIIPFLYDYIQPRRQQDGKMIGFEVTQKEKRGLTDMKGSWLSKPQWDEIGYAMTDGLIYVEKDGKYGFVDKSGKTISAAQWDWVYPFSGGLAVVSKNGKSGYIDKTGKVVVDLIYDQASSFWNGKAEVNQGDTAFIIDSKGKVLFSTDMINDKLDGSYQSARKKIESYNNEQIIIMVEAGLVYSFDWDGNLLLDRGYDLAEPFHNGLAKVYEGPTMESLFVGYGDSEEAVRAEYESVGGYSTAVRKPSNYEEGGEYHFIDKAGRVVLSYPKEVDSTWTGYGDFKQPLMPNENGELPIGFTTTYKLDDKIGVLVLEKVTE